ncbi:NAD(P)H-dependent oxidoreductase subunit E [Burkholderiaceae bacterium FT117]|uniref:NAD(P)H-dependent oxidoreductase subunit E n=1 Tax=Zeimonas sediminis TaxID=2944268 RepID=UPI0023431383|nr:NAD(P)H-dependent oxidoreductase subunit E [Zeimonas sediminis]MCM5572181.1 NAD(P)H-dependent oxidoreductase subunit E [Zeimonas sediminis]
MHQNRLDQDSPSAYRRPPGKPKGRQPDEGGRERLRALLGDAPRRRDLLIEHLHRIQDAEGCLSASMIAALADEMRLSQAEVFEVASFYHHFDLVGDGAAPPPALTVRVCESISCAMAGGEALADALPALLGAGVRVQRVPCVGRCEQAPVAVVGRFPVGAATTDSVRAAVDGGLRECPLPDAQDLDAYLAAGGYRALAAVLAGSGAQGGAMGGAGPAMTREQVIDRLEAAGLRGLGGAGFPAARKWRAVAGEPGPRMLVVNADEGEPGTFKDRHCLETAPHRMLEGMLIAAAVVGCDDCWIYLRDEYAGVRALLERELAALRARPPVPGMRLPGIHLRRGAGAYICGEESALIESLEGKRGMPRLRPPYVAQVGLFGRPTLAHNVETLERVAAILAEPAGADGRPDGSGWAAHGRRGRRGLRFFSVSGRVRQPGVKHAPAGISLRELIDEHCGGMADGHELYGYLPGGASGGILPASLADLPLDFDTLQPYGSFIGSAAIVVLSRQDLAREAAVNLMDFFRHESCGQCTPCRAGTAKASKLLRAPDWDTGLLEELSGAMADASICGLGQAAPNPVRSVIRWFGHELGGQAAPDRARGAGDSRGPGDSGGGR